MIDEDDLPPELRDKVHRLPIAEELPLEIPDPEVTPTRPEQQTDDRGSEAPFLRRDS